MTLVLYIIYKVCLLGLRYQLYGVACDDDFLVGRNHNHLDLGVIGRENLLDAAAVVALLVHLDAKVSRPEQESQRTPSWFSPTPAVHTMMSTPFMAAA